MRSDMAPEISGIPVIVKILHAHRLQQKRILIQLAVPAFRTVWDSKKKIPLKKKVSFFVPVFFLRIIKK